ncbi:unnamed protein product [Strongylus vulgaris]|uniref:Uncharacterized protein n=1 Tax=Strongylus vulgaris TaxID=40348 RepID=A0A3P7K3S3_STRVU|nr:unnamed protein product [Strongylus vulgaris]
MDFTIIEKVFDTWSDFEVWREEKELETSSKLVKRTFRKSNTWTTIMYTCQHARGTDRQHLVRLIFEVRLYRDGLVEVVACFGHCGHVHPLPLFKTEVDDYEDSESVTEAKIHKILEDHGFASTSASGAYTLDSGTIRLIFEVRLYRDGLVEVVACFGHCGHVHPLPLFKTEVDDYEDSESVTEAKIHKILEDHGFASTSASGAYTLDSGTSSSEGNSQSQACSNGRGDDVAEGRNGDIHDEEIVVDDFPRPVPSEDTVAKEKTLEAYRRFEKKLVQMGEVMQMFVEEQRYDLMNKFSEVLDILMQQVPSELASQTSLGKLSNV